VVVCDTAVDSGVSRGATDAPRDDTHQGEAAVSLLDHEGTAAVALARVSIGASDVVTSADHIGCDVITWIFCVTESVGRDVECDVAEGLGAAHTTGVDGSPSGASGLPVVVVIGPVRSADWLEVSVELNGLGDLDEGDVVDEGPGVVALMDVDRCHIQRLTSGVSGVTCVVSNNDRDNSWGLSLHAVGGSDDPPLVDDGTSAEMRVRGLSANGRLPWELMFLSLDTSNDEFASRQVHVSSIGVLTHTTGSVVPGWSLSDSRCHEAGEDKKTIHVEVSR